MGRIKVFGGNSFCLKMPTELCRKTFCAVLQKFAAAKKFIDVGGGGGERGESIKILRRIFFIAHCRKNHAG